MQRTAHHGCNPTKKTTKISLNRQGQMVVSYLVEVIRRDYKVALDIVLTEIRVSVTAVAVLDFIISAEKFMSFLSDVNPP